MKETLRKYINRLLPEHWHLILWHKTSEKPKEGHGVYCKTIMSKDDKAAFYRNGQYINIYTNEPMEYVTWWRYSY